MSTDKGPGGPGRLLLSLVPPPLVRALPARRRRKYIRAAVATGRHARVPGLVGRPDPFPETTLFAAADLLLTSGEDGALEHLAPLAGTAAPFARAVFEALCAHGRGDSPDATIAEAWDHAASGHQRTCAQAWALFLRLPRIAGNGTGEGPPVFQYWDTPEVPPDVAAAIDGWRALAGGGHTLLDARAARTFLKAEHGTPAVAVFDACLHPAIQSDLLRLAWLARHGGLFMDADARMRRGFPALWPLLAGRDVAWFYTHAAEGHFTNGVLACRPGSPLAEAAFDETARRILQDPQGHVYSLGGPGMLSDVILGLADTPALDHLHVLTTETVRRRVMSQIPAAYKHTDRSWHRWQKAKPWETDP